MNKLGKFHGGLALTGHKQVTEITDSRLPSSLIYPLLQRAESYATPCVKVGEHVLKGQLIAQSNSAVIHAASSGTITAIATHPIAHPSGLDDTCIFLSTDGMDDSIPTKPCANYQHQSPETLRQLIYQAGIVGLGGALFPTAIKLHSATPIDTLIINGAECEPYISCDASLMLQHSEQIIQGALILQALLCAKKCIIAIEESTAPIQQALQQAIKAQTSSNSAISLQIVPAIYPSGGEKQLIQILTGSKIAPASLPTAHGILCQNVGTVFAIYQAITLGIPLTERIITVTGNGIKHAKNFRAHIGTPISHLIEQCGGYTPTVERLIMGGSMMGIALKSDTIALTKATNCILGISADELHSQPAEMPCIRCGDCATVCPVELLPQQLHWYGHSKQFAQSQDYRLFDCIECGCCDLVCPSHIPLVQSFRASKGEIIIKQQQAKQAMLAKSRHENQLQRKAKAEQDKQAAAEKRKATIAKMKAAAKKPAS